eukprot:SAG25_NODE_10540_length_330_cov_0.670996_1_plen_58_part_10
MSPELDLLDTAYVEIDEMCVGTNLALEIGNHCPFAVLLHKYALSRAMLDKLSGVATPR